MVVLKRAWFMVWSDTAPSRHSSGKPRFQVLWWNGWWWKWVIRPLSVPPLCDCSWLGIYIYYLFFCEFNSGVMNNTGGSDCGQRYPTNQEPARRPPVGQRYDSDPYWRQEHSAVRQSRPQELSNGQTKEEFVAEMLARPSNAESGPGRPQARPRQHQDDSPAQGRTQSAPSEVSISGCQQIVCTYFIATVWFWSKFCLIYRNRQPTMMQTLSEQSWNSPRMRS